MFRSNNTLVGGGGNIAGRQPLYYRVSIRYSVPESPVLPVPLRRSCPLEHYTAVCENSGSAAGSIDLRFRGRCTTENIGCFLPHPTVPWYLCGTGRWNRALLTNTTHGIKVRRAPVLVNTSRSQNVTFQAISESLRYSLASAVRMAGP